MKTDNLNSLHLSDLFILEEKDEDTILYFKNNFKNLMVYDPGLYHTAICKSRMCKIDKKDGMLYYRGVKVTDKLDEDFLDIAYDVIFGKEFEKKEQFKQSVYFHLKLLPEQKTLIDAIPLSVHPMDLLAISIIALSGLEEKYLNQHPNLLERASFIIAQVAVSVSYYYTKLKNIPWAHQEHSNYAYGILHQMHNGTNPTKLKTLSQILNTIMILHCEHGQNCSAVAVRTIASSRGSIYTAVAAGMSAFNGSIHGGASQFVSSMYEELLEGKIDIESYVDQKIARKELIMGFGQRTYNRIENCWDPRVKVMHQILMSHSFNFPEVKREKEIAVKLIDYLMVHPFIQARNLTPNPDLFNCIFFKLFGAPREMNTVMLALGRVVGWIANYIEHTEDRYPLTRPCDIFEDVVSK